MNILFACDYFPPFTPGGAEWSVFYLAKGLVKKGHNIMVITPNYGAKNYEIVDGVEIYRFPFIKKLEKGQKQVRYKWHINPFFYLYFAWCIYKIGRKKGIDIIHAQHRNSLPPVFIAGKLLKKPVFLTIRDTSLICPIGALCLLKHNNIPNNCNFWELIAGECGKFHFVHYIKGGIFKKIKTKVVLTVFHIDLLFKKWLMKKISTIFGVSQGILDVYIKAGILEKEKVRVIYNPIPEIKVDNFKIDPKEVKKQYGIEGKKVILYAGKLSLGKGTHVLIQAADIVKGSISDVVFLLAGKGKVEVKPKRADVKFLGSLSHEEILKLYSLADIVVLPSIWPEPFSRIPLEAAIFEKPCIGTNVGGTPESILDGETGIIVEKGRPDELATAIIRLLRDESLRLPMGKKAKEFASQKFNPNTITKDLLKVYNANGTATILGLLPPLSGGLRSLKRVGQHTRLINAYIKRYINTFDKVYYFSYFDETIKEYTQEAELLEKVKIFPKKLNLPNKLYALLLPFIYGKQFRECSILRVFHISGTPPAIIVKVLYGIPYITTYGYKYAEFAKIEHYNYYKTFLFQIIEICGLKFSNRVIVTTKELEDYVQKRIDKKKISYIPNGADVSLFSPVPRNNRLKKEKELIFIGRLMKQKNLFKLIDALKILKNRQNINLTIIGKGPLYEELSKYIEKQGVKVKFIAPVVHTDLPEYLNRADVFVLPSLIEGHPKVLIEAMSCGLPCVVSDCDGNRIMVKDAENGLLFDPYDAKQMAQKIEMVLADNIFAERLGKKARAFVIKNYNIKNLLETEVKLLTKVMSKKSSRVFRGKDC